MYTFIKYYGIIFIMNLYRNQRDKKMKMEKIVNLLVIILTGCMITGSLASSLYAEDYYIEKHTKTIIDGEMMGAVSTLELWVKGDWVRYLNSNDKDNVLIIKMDEDKVYQVNGQEKTVQEIDLKSKFVALEKQIQVSSKKTGEKKKIDQWEAYQVLLTSAAKGASTEVEYWLSDKIHYPMETRIQMAAYFGQGKIIDELKKYPGYPVEIIVHLKVQNKKIDMTTSLIKLEKRNVDKKLFEIPDDYKKIELPSKKPAGTFPKPKDEKSKSKIAPQPDDISVKEDKK